MNRRDNKERISGLKGIRASRHKRSGTSSDIRDQQILFKVNILQRFSDMRTILVNNELQNLDLIINNMA